MDGPHPGIVTSFADDFLGSIADHRRTPMACGAGIAVVVAHPDDETLACGATLARLSDVQLVVVTDGAPRDLADARMAGFDSALAYAGARAAELERAAEIAGINRGRLVELEMPDQTVALRMEELANGLAALIEARRIRLVLTHAFEGGHPDHDSVAFAVHAAAALVARRQAPVELIEMPFYREGSNGEMVLQSFAPYFGVAETRIRLGRAERFLKEAMLAAHATQAATLAPFDTGTERFRVAPRYDFAAPPNEGRILYARYGWGLRSGAEWVGHARKAAASLGLGDVLCRRS
jgi:LmbE family N-acetylglucosaminyl deacetylase